MKLALIIATLSVILVFMLMNANKNNGQILKLFNNPREKIYLNYTQDDYLKLEKLFLSLCSGGSNKHSLRKLKFVESTNATMDLETRMNADKIMGIVLCAVNDKSDFKFQLTGLNRVKYFEDNDRNRNYIIDCYVQDPIKMFDLRLNVDVVAYKTQEPDLYKYTYSIGIPSKDQMIPTPMDVIPTANEVLTTSSAKPMKPIEMVGLHMNCIKIMNSNLTLDGPDNMCVDNAEGLNDTSLEYCPETGGNDPYIQKAPCRNPWPKLKKEPPLKMWPCQAFINTWNNLGVNPAITSKNENEAHCSVLQPRPEYSAQFWMSNVFNGAPRDNIYDNSLFRLSIGIPSFPTGRSNSG